MLVHDRPCRECKHSKNLTPLAMFEFSEWICTKHLMAISRDMHVSYDRPEQLCFEARSPDSGT
jgi:hypothetical protein